MDLLRRAAMSFATHLTASLPTSVPATSLIQRDTASSAQPVAAFPPPPGQTANFVNPPTAADDMIVFVVVGITIAGLFMILRIYTKNFVLRKFGLEDIAIILAFLCTTATCILIIEGRRYGTGKHIWDVPAQDLLPWGKIVTAATVLYVPSMMFAKLAILLAFLRISPKLYFRVAVYITIALVASYCIALMLVLIFACDPIAKNWNSTILTGHCVNKPAVYLANAVLNIVTDFVIISLPVPMIRHLNMPLRSKLLLAGMFSVGSLACVISIIRLTTLIPTLHNVDATWAIAGPGIWIIIELNVAISCGCLSVIRPFLRHHFPALLGESRNTRSERYNKATPLDYFGSNQSGGGYGKGGNVATTISNASAGNNGASANRLSRIRRSHMDPYASFDDDLADDNNRLYSTDTAVAGGDHKSSGSTAGVGHQHHSSIKDAAIVAGAGSFYLPSLSSKAKKQSRSRGVNNAANSTLTSSTTVGGASPPFIHGLDEHDLESGTLKGIHSGGAAGQQSLLPGHTHGFTTTTTSTTNTAGLAAHPGTRAKEDPDAITPSVSSGSSSSGTYTSSPPQPADHTMMGSMSNFPRGGALPAAPNAHGAGGGAVGGHAAVGYPTYPAPTAAVPASSTGGLPVVNGETPKDKIMRTVEVDVQR